MSRGKSFSCSAESLSLLSFLQIVMVIIVNQTCDATTITNNQTYCPPSSCGKITNITHPFRLKGDPTSCGDPRYELSCENNITTLTLFKGKYYVKSINYENYTIQIVDPGIQEGNCSSIPSYFLTSFNFTSSYVVNGKVYTGDPYQIDSYFEYNKYQYIIYLKCSKEVKDDPGYVDTSPCRVNSDSKSYVYAFVEFNYWEDQYHSDYVENYLDTKYLTVERLKDDCQVKLVAISSSDFEPNSYQQIHGMLLHGFQLSWLSGSCRELCGDNQRCNFNSTTRDVECEKPSYFAPPPVPETGYCRYPWRLGEGCYQKPKLRILVGDFIRDILFGINKGALQIIGKRQNYTLTSSNKHISIAKIGIEIGRVTGRYILPPFIVRVLLGLMMFFVLLIYTCRRKHISIYENIEVFLQANTLMPIRYSYKEIKMMTGSLRDELGKGGFGSVYKGKLRSGPFVAIKMLSKSKGNGQDFINEVATIGRIHHTNVVRLIGFCFEGSKRALVYEFMPNGSLDKYISSREDAISLTYKQMYEISLGVARGIAYLHQGCDMQILHFDIKPHNILLDENFIPKVSDFGLAKLYPNDMSIVTLTAARGTIGYMAPELFYQNIGGVSYKADVYSFGMLLMEMASKRRNLNPHADRSSQLFFPFWIYNQLIEEKDIEMDELTNEEMINVKKMFITALWCIQLKPSDRPSMNKVIEMLEGNIENIEMPPKPSLYPNETIQNDLDATSDEIESDADDDSVILLKETSL
ncbi:unnamed protein product [Trifolium pratense]|uniref:Uncharacterized protein n=1 Tax=Trifolium pratense TaxID=57577 RepID=A0ACB0LYJ7_TRIPR|nr:unnamed protein product [Trifolium pratense]